MATNSSRLSKDRQVVRSIPGLSLMFGAVNAPLFIANPSAAEVAAPADNLAAVALLNSMGERKRQHRPRNADSDRTDYSEPCRVYVVQTGDTLWSILQRFYGNPLMWPPIYYADQSQFHNELEVYPGQELIMLRTGIIASAIT